MAIKEILLVFACVVGRLRDVLRKARSYHFEPFFMKNERWQVNGKTGRKERKRTKFKEKKEVKGRSLHYFEKNIEETRYTICILAKITNMKRIGIINEETLKSHIKDIFLQHDHQDNVIIDLYKMILPEWDDIEQLHGHPVCGEKLWHFICELCINFDKIHHPRCLAGGAWINYGYSSDSQLDPWEINLSDCSITYKETGICGTHQQKND